MRIEDLQGRRIGRYEVTGLLGRGGMAAVYRARDTALHREIALKILYPQYLHDEDQIARFKREAVVAAGLDHPNIVQIYDVGEDQGLVYIAMQLLPGRSLADVLRERGRLGLQELAPIVDQIASALDYAHARGIIHRDIKPANILIEADGRAVLTDFGIAKMLDAPGFTSTSVMIGTPDYMAPEQIGSQPIDARVDIYALGVLVFRTITGRRPFEGGTDEVLLGHLNGTPPAVSSLVPGLPGELDAIIRTAMARRPDGRYRHAGDFAAELREAAGLPPSMSHQRRRPAPVVPVLSPATLAADAPTARGSVHPVAMSPIDPATRTAPNQTGFEPATIGRTTQPEAPRRSNPLLPIVVALLLVIAAGGGFLLARELRDNQNSNGGGVIVGPTDEAPTAVPTTGTPSTPPGPTVVFATVIVTAVPELTVAPTEPGEPSATSAPSEPTRAPTQAPVKTPTTAPPPATNIPVVTQTATPSPTLTPTVTLTPSPTLSPTPEVTSTPTATPIALRGGFKAIYESISEVRSRLGKPLEEEHGFVGAEQQFEKGGMFWAGHTNQGGDDTIYVLFDNNQWLPFPLDKQLGRDTPPTAAPENKRLPNPKSGIGTVWGTHSEFLQTLGYPTTDEYNTDGAYQRFQGGVMLFSQKGLDAKEPSIYVLYDGAEYVRYKDPNSP